MTPPRIDGFGRRVYDSAGRRALERAVQHRGVSEIAELVGVAPSTITRLQLGLAKAPTLDLALALEDSFKIAAREWLTAPGERAARFAPTQRFSRQDDDQSRTARREITTMSNVQPPYPPNTKVPNPDAERRQQNPPAQSLPTKPIVIPSPKDLPKSAPLGPSQDPNSSPVPPFLDTRKTGPAPTSPEPVSPNPHGATKKGG